MMSISAVIIPCYNRGASLQRLLNSLLTADYGAVRGQVTLVFSIDGGGSDDVIRIAESFDWTHGEKRIIQHAQNIGLRQNIISCGDLSEQYGAVVVLEDDLVVSPGFYLYATKAGQFYYEEDRIGQISLYAYEYTELGVFRFMPCEDGNDVYFMQWASSWGQLWTSRQWQSFRSWLEQIDSDTLNKISMPEYVKGWPATSWKKYFIGYLVDTNRYAAYPRVGYATCFGDAGANRPASMLPIVNSPLAFQAPKSFRFVHFSESYVCYDSFFEPEKCMIDILSPELASYDYEVDLHGVKPLERLSCEYLLSVRDNSSALSSFSWNVRPMGMQLIPSAGEGDINWGLTDTFDAKVSLRKKIRLAYWSHGCMGARRGFLYAAIRFLFHILRKQL
tara:strand:- start:1165 stop:2334 length:1170 start_codon:yes stop_codon:yes gene_type:complete